MKKLIVFLLFFAAVAIVAIQACNKDKAETAAEESQSNLPPVANAGLDTVISITICEQKATARLDGHLSYDPGTNSFIRYVWKQISGPTRAFEGVDSTRNIVTVNNLVSGDYLFKLEVFDAKNLTDNDVLGVSVIDKVEYNDLELNLTPGFEFYDNYDYYGYFYDDFIINGSANIGNSSYAFNFYQSSDSTSNNTEFTNYFNMYNSAGWPKSISGQCTVDFETIYIKGGGNFNGTIKVNGGSAFPGCDSELNNFPPIEITGSMDTTTKVVTMKFKGKIVL